MKEAVVFVGFAAASAVMNWTAIYRKNVFAERVFKPLTMVLLIVAALMIPVPLQNIWLKKMFIAGLTFSLFGDVFLMIPHNNRWFLAGLVAFLLGHVAYIAGFNRDLPPLDSLPLLFTSFIAAALVLRVIVRGLLKKGAVELIPPVIAYCLVITLMLYSGLATLFRPDWTMLSSVVCIVSAALFFISDSFLSYGMFVAIKKTRFNSVVVMVTYFLAQIGFTITIATWQV